jgi:DNA-binding response OmpR family regulator
MQRILIVEDEKNILMTTRLSLENQGYQVFTEVDGADVVKTVIRVQPDLILLDIKLPHVDGLLVCEAIRNLEAFKEVPIVFASAKTDDLTIKRAFEVGGNDFLQKPFTRQELESIVKKHLKPSRTR